MNEPAPEISAGVSQDDKTMGMLAHLSALVSIGPLIIWLMNKDKPDKEFVNTEAKEALNFVISIWIVMIGAMIVSTILAFIPVLGWIASILIWLAMMAVGLGGLVFIIIAAMKANEGVNYRYPVNLRLVK
jgi:uncharacterized Tic20 family protein